jgi:hypothetical protein
MTRRFRRAWALSCTFAAIAWAPGASAAPVELAATPLLGAGAPAERGWQSYAVRLRATSTVPVHGTVELSDGSGATTRAPFAVAPAEQMMLELYTHDGFGKGLEVVARDRDGAVLSRAPISSPHADAPLLVDLGRTARLEAALRDEHVAVRWLARSWAPAAGLDLAVTHAAADSRSGELVLPERALGYSSATVVLVASDTLAALPEQKAAALLDWVLTGGSLAVTVAQSGDLAHPRLAALLGGKAVLGAAPELAQSTEFDTVDPDTTPAAVPSYKTLHVAPAAEVAERLVRVTGGELRATRWGSSRALGLGEVHALAFDPTSTAFVDDPWVRRSTVDLVRAAWDRRASIALGGDATFDEARTDSTRRLLDPNEGSRWSVWFSAIVLVVYALLAGPLSFRRAARRGTPLRAFVELPLWSFGTVFFIVLVGAIAKGGRSRARRLSFIECGAGETRGAIVRFRALFASSADSLQVSALDRTSLLDVAGSTSGIERALVIGRETAELVDLRGRPWETVVVREDGLIDLRGAVRFVTAGRDWRIENGLERDLLAVVARAPGGELKYLSRIRHGESVSLDSGKTISFPPSVPAGPMAPALPSPHRLDPYRFAALADADVKGNADAWVAIEAAMRDTVGYWPDERAVLIGELDGGDGATRDSGLAVDYDRVLLRVLGGGQ